MEFKPECMALLIGSIPMSDHNKALELVCEYTPEIPLWVQLPMYKNEGMIEQFLHGIPSLVVEKEKIFIDTTASDFEDNLLKFYNDYIESVDKSTTSFAPRFTLTDETAKGFSTFINYLKSTNVLPTALKGQITGPVTFAIATVDQNKRSIFYDERLKDVAIKLIAMKARWQAGTLAKFSRPAIVFLDEPALAGFGSSSFASISREDGLNALNEAIDAIHMEKGLAGIHICANSDWSLALDTPADIISFDAYSFFDKFILYPKHIKKFIESGRSLAFGIVPTGNIEDIENATTEKLLNKIRDQFLQIENLGLDRKTITEQSYITPSCGTGSLSLAHAKKVLRLTKEISKELRKK